MERMWMEAIALCAILQVPADHAERALVEEAPRRNRSGYVAKEGRGYFHIPGLPLPLTPREMECWSWLLQLSDAQRSHLNSLLQQYVSDEQDLHRRYVQPIWDRSGELAGSYMGAAGGAGDIRIAMAIADLVEKSVPAAVRRIIQVENELFDQLPAILGESQLPQLETVKKLRQRTRCRLVDVRYPGGDIDLVYVLNDLRHREFDLTLHGDETLEAVIARYSADATPLFELRREASLQIASKGAIAQATMLGGTPAGRDEAREQLTRVNQQLVHAEKRIHEFNTRYIEFLRSRLPESTAAALGKDWRERVYPTIYPDASDPEDVLNKAYALLPPDLAKSSEFNDVRMAVMIRHAEICAAMEREWLEWRQRLGVEWSYQAARVDDFEQNVTKLEAQRRANGRVAIAHAIAFLSEQDAGDLNAAIRAYEERLKRRQFVLDPRMGR